jgi:hypothetical protein
MKLSARIAGVGLVGPGLASWGAARNILAGREPHVSVPTVVPSPEALPPTERRRAGKGVRLALGAGLAAAADAGLEPRGLVATFTSSTGDGENIHAICEALASDDRLISPTRFHNSVHNAPSGYWGIATGAMEDADSLAAFDASFGAGLLEAMCRVASGSSPPVLLVAYDSPYPEPLLATRPLPDCFAVGLVITPEGTAAKGARIEIELTHAAPTPLAENSLERVRREIPSARALPMLAQLARAEPGCVVVEYLDGLSIAVEVMA